MRQFLRDFLTDAASRDAANRVQLTIRELLRHWDAERRGYHIVARIERDLAEYHLRTQPDFTRGWIDNTIALVPTRPHADQQQQSAATVQSGTTPMPDAPSLAMRPPGLQVASLESASRGVCSVTPEQDLLAAQSTMMRFGYSQLAVAVGRDLKGAISWESIAQARLRKSDAQLGECVVAATDVQLEDDLIAVIPKIIDAGFVFVRGPDRSLCGIVTTADLGKEFAELAKPFFLIAEVERRLRNAIGSAFPAESLAAAIDPSDPGRVATSADDLTMGEYIRLLERPENWATLGWNADRKIFMEACHSVREIRNEVMHFSPDPLTVEQLQTVETFIVWLRMLAG